MLHIEIDDVLINKENIKTVQKLKKKVEKDLLLFPGIQLYVNVKTKTAKANAISMYAMYLEQKFFEETFISKSWELTIQQSVSYLLRSIRTEFLSRKNQKSATCDTL